MLWRTHASAGSADGVLLPVGMIVSMGGSEPTRRGKPFVHPNESHPSSAMSGILTMVEILRDHA